MISTVLISALVGIDPSYRSQVVVLTSASSLFILYVVNNMSIEGELSGFAVYKKYCVFIFMHAFGY